MPTTRDVNTLWDNQTASVPNIRLRRLMFGIVQGVGFRPTVALHAAGRPITGFVGNDDVGVFIEAQGDSDDVLAFFDAIDDGLPPLARVDAVECTAIPPVAGETGFRIVASLRTAGAVTLIPPDVAPCPDCLHEMADATNRRYHYPFITCTNCGPRLSIIKDVPYDRPLTTMAGFPMCPACQAEYTDPTNRRYHAQPISCFDCGPTLWLEDAQHPGVPPILDGPARREAWDATIAEARRLLAAGAIIAVKGIGGFTIMADARNPATVARLRERKHRPDKPFATMCADLTTARHLADLDDATATLTGAERPIVLAPMAPTYDLADAVAPRLDRIGIMLPFAPLHVLLVQPGDCLIATSGNLSGEPLASDNDDARARLHGIVDYFLMHDRPIHVSVEDSVVMVGAGPSEPARLAPNIIPIRRSRGYAPLPVRLAPPGGPDISVLAVGGELKNTFALVRDGMAFLSPHLGDMAALASQQAFEASIKQLTRMHRRSPQIVVADKHPGYATTAWATRYADETGCELLLVQHHHAHALSLLADQKAVGKKALIATLDGTGYGDDASMTHAIPASIWGGEILALSENPLEYERVWHLPGFWFDGGDSAVRRPWKLAAGLLAACGIDGTGLIIGDAQERRLVASQLISHEGCVWTTSAGRVFDAVASILGVCQEQTYEGQAGTELEAHARRCQHHDHDWSTPQESLPGLIEMLVSHQRRGVPNECLANEFHRGFAGLIAAALNNAAERLHPELIGLSGGVAQNQLFCGYLRAGIGPGRVLVEHVTVPSNDGGLSLGQALAGYLVTLNKER